MSGHFQQFVSIGIMFIAVTANANTSTEELKSRILDQVRDAHSITLSAEELQSIPKSIVCSDDSDYQQEVSGLRDPQITLKTTLRKDTVLVDLSDGDQVSGYILLLSDLKDLANHKKSSIEAISFEGFWWADGNHYGFSDKAVRCQLK